MSLSLLIFLKKKYILSLGIFTSLLGGIIIFINFITGSNNELVLAFSFYSWLVFLFFLLFSLVLSNKKVLQFIIREKFHKKEFNFREFQNQIFKLKSEDGILQEKSLDEYVSRIIEDIKKKHDDEDYEKNSRILMKYFKKRWIIKKDFIKKYIIELLISVKIR